MRRRHACFRGAHGPSQQRVKSGTSLRRRRRRSGLEWGRWERAVVVVVVVAARALKE
jgi:hypothetical protein